MAARLLSKWVRKYQESVLLKRLLAVLSIDILVKLSGIILLPIYLRLMTQDQFGLYGYLLSAIQIFSLVLNFGLYIPLSKFYHDHHEAEQRGTLLFTLFSTLTGLLACVLVPVYFFRWDYLLVRFLFKNPVDYESYRVSILLAVVVSVCNFMLTSFFYTSEKITQLKRYNIARILSINILTVTVLFLLKDRDSVRVRLESTYVIEAILFLLFCRVLVKESGIRFSRSMAQSGLKLALPVMISAILGIVINFSDKFFLEKYGSFTNLSYYYLAVSCASVIPMIFTSFQNAWLPLFLKQKDVRKNIATTNRLMLRLFLGFLGLSLCILLFVKLILALGIIQHKYEETIYILPLMLLSQIVSALVPLYTNYLIYFEKTYVITFTGLFICGISIGLSLLLIPRFGVYGAAGVSLVSNASYLTAYYFIIKTYIKKHLAGNDPLAEK